MYPASFDYLRAASVEEALSLLDSHEDAKLLAGGHSLIPMMKLRLAQPATVIDIGRIDSLSGISENGGALTIGPLTTHAEIAASGAVQQHCAFLAEAAGHIGDPQVRNRGTIGGNIAHADPGLGPARGSTGGLRHRSTSRAAPANARCLPRPTSSSTFSSTELQEKGGPDQASRSRHCLAGTGAAYLKFEHPASGYAVVGAAATVTMSGGSCSTGKPGLQRSHLDTAGHRCFRTHRRSRATMPRSKLLPVGSRLRIHSPTSLPAATTEFISPESTAGEHSPPRAIAHDQKLRAA